MANHRHQRTTRASLLASSNLSSLIRADDDDKEEKKEEERGDADAGSTLDKTLSHLADSIGKINSRLDAMEDRRSDRRDADKDEDEDEKKADAEDDDKPKEEAERVAADKSKKDAAEDEEKMAADKAKKDSAKKDEDKEEEGERGDSVTISRADLQALRDQLSQHGRLLSDVAKVMPRDRTDSDAAAFADTQARADSVYHAFSRAAPAPMSGEDLQAYRIRLARGLASHSEKFKDVNLHSIGDSKMLEVAIDGIYADALHAANNPETAGAGELRRVVRHSGGHEFADYVGDSRSWMYPIAGPVRQFVTDFSGLNP